MQPRNLINTIPPFLLKFLHHGMPTSAFSYLYSEFILHASNNYCCERRIPPPDNRGESGGAAKSMMDSDIEE